MGRAHHGRELAAHHDLVALVEAERRVHDHFPRLVREAAFYLRRPAETARLDAEHVHVLVLQHVAHLGERSRLHDPRTGADCLDRLRRHQLGRAEGTGATFGHHELVSAEHRDDAPVLAFEVLEHATEGQR